jgi:hypothetical protein
MNVVSASKVVAEKTVILRIEIIFGTILYLLLAM